MRSMGRVRASPQAEIIRVTRACTRLTKFNEMPERLSRS